MKTKRLIFGLVMALMLLAALEASSYVAGKVLQSKWGMWKVPTTPAKAKVVIPYDEYLKRRDPVVGWPYPEQYGRDLGRNGAHPSLHFPDGPDGPGGRSCLSLYGDSFTEGVGDTTAADKVWSNIVSAELNCYVANFGMGGYGTDQAYLRFERNLSDASPVVIFGVHTENVMRNLTRIRDLQNYQTWFALKPRFVLNARGDIELVPIPELTREQYLRAIGVAAPLMELEHENFQPGGPAGVVILEFPFTWSVVKNLMRFHALHARLRKQPEWMTFLQKGHPFQGLEVTAGITRRFVETAKARGKAPLVVVLPHPMDFKYFVEKGTWPYQPLIDEYKHAAIPFIDFGPYLISAWKERGGKLDAHFGATSHYTDQGSALVARFVLEQLRERGLEPSAR